MNILDALITDRTPADVELVRKLNEKGWAEMFPDERALWGAKLKGSYDYRDMNRVVEALEYVDGLMTAAGTRSGYAPVLVPHKVPEEFGGNGLVTQWNIWRDKVWIRYDFPTPALWAAHLDNIRKIWAGTRRISAQVLPVYDPGGGGAIKPDESFTAGDVCRILECNGLLELRAAVSCPPGAVEVSGEGWAADGASAVLAYPGGRWPDVDDALSALAFRCTVPDGVIDVSVSFFATLRHDVERPLGTCAVHWSPYIRWSGAKKLWGSWGEAKPLTWEQMSEGGADNG